MTNLTIRPFEPTDEEYKSVVALVNAEWPDDPASVEIWKHNDNIRNPNYHHERFVGEVGDGSGSMKIVAVGAVWESIWTNKPGKYNFDLDVTQGYREQGLDTPFYQHLADSLADRNPTELKTWTREDKTLHIDFLKKMGFEQTLREPDSQLDVPAFDFTPFAGAQEKVAASGIEILTLSELQERDANWMQKLYDLEIAVEQDVPDTDDLTPAGLEEYAKNFKRPHIRPDAWFIAVDGMEYVGLSNLWPNTVLKDKLGVGITGVLRSHRRRGIATALKLRTIEFAQEYGAKIIETGNEENNPMYDLNMKLGFKPTPAYLTFEKCCRS
ncbi:MAG: GNAT family N-acetyltransferase [Chloroflexota bacterium]